MNKITIRSGSEGPSHDPYHFTEITFEGRFGTIKHHAGLATWTEWKGKLVREQHARDCFFGVVGFMPEEIEKFYYRMKQRRFLNHVKRCGRKNIESAPGYPGETLTYCKKCGDVLDCDFNRSAVE